MVYYLLGGLAFFGFGIMWLYLFLTLTGSIIFVLDFGSVLSTDKMELVFLFDSFSCSFLLLLSFMVSSVYFFCILYLNKELKNLRFFLLLLMFVMSMQMLMVSPKLMSFILGWDGLGFSSFLLVGWFGAFSSWSASMKTFLVNRFGDSFFLIAMSYFFLQGHFNLFSLDLFIGNFIFFLLLFALSTKSAQFPFSSWLPAAMAAPTPVSALVHSSTLVTAGLYFYIRFSYMFSYKVSFFVGILGLITMLVGSFCAILEMDLKKVVAFSTLSQLGFMGFVVGIGFFNLAFFYLLVHASFKALMFISMGLYMLNGTHFQDLRSLKKMWYSSPLVFVSLFLSISALSGIPFLSAFYMKDLMIFSFSILIFKYILVFVFMVSLIFTLIYSFRLFFKVSFSKMKFLVSCSFESMSLLVLFPLFVSSIFLGMLFSKYTQVFYKTSSFSFLLVSLMTISGIFLGSMLYNFTFSKFIYFYKSLKLIFFCQYLKVSFNSLFLSGSLFFYFLDSGIFSLNFMDKLSSLFSYNFNSLYLSFYSLSWLSLVFFSYSMLFGFFLLWNMLFLFWK